MLFNACLVADTTSTTPAYTAPVHIGCQPIVINPILFKQIPEDAALLILLHEYAHILHQHGTKPADPRVFEREADCTAARMLHATWPNRLWPALRVWRHFSGDAEHDPGPMRVMLMALCAAYPELN